MTNAGAKTILILTANPKDTDKRRLDEEVREIEAGLERSRRREHFRIISRWAVRPKDLRRSLLDLEPSILHFSGYGEGEEGLVLESETGQAKLVSVEALASLFSLFEGKIECVLLNACYSEEQAEAICSYADCVIGLSKAIEESAAIAFSIGFYDALGAGRSFEDAYKFGCSAVDFENVGSRLAPVLKKRLSEHKFNKNEKEIVFDEKENVAPSLRRALPKGKKLALLIGVSQYGAGFTSLPEAVKDIEAIKNALQISEDGEFCIQTLPNPDVQSMQTSINDLFEGCEKNDLVLLFFSGHGVKENGDLYLGARGMFRDNSGDLVKSSAVLANDIHKIMDRCRSIQQVIILDCCFSGAFPNTLIAKGNGAVDLKAQLAGVGRAVLASSTAMQSSFALADKGLSFYTQHIVNGICTGSADLDGDGFISTKDLHIYVTQKAKELLPAAKPVLYAEQEGEAICLARNPLQKRVVESNIVRSCNARKERSLGPAPIFTRVLDRARTLRPLSKAIISLLLVLFSLCTLALARDIYQRKRCIYIKKVLDYDFKEQENPQNLNELESIRDEYYASPDYIDQRRRCNALGVYPD